MIEPDAQVQFSTRIRDFLDFTQDLEVQIEREPQGDLIDKEGSQFGQDSDYFRVNGYYFSDFMFSLEGFDKTFRQLQVKHVKDQLGTIITSLIEARENSLEKIKLKSSDTSYRKQTFKILISGGLAGESYIPSYYHFAAIYHPFHNRAIKEINRKVFLILDGLIGFLSYLKKELSRTDTNLILDKLHGELVANEVLDATIDTFTDFVTNTSTEFTPRITWLLKDKSGKNTDNRSLFYFLSSLRDARLIAYEERDINNIILHSFKRHDGTQFDKRNLSSSYSAYRNVSRGNQGYRTRYAGILDLIIKKALVSSTTRK